VDHEKLVVSGGNPLRGRIEAGGAKNSALKLMAATLLAEGSYRIERVPRIVDVQTMVQVLGRLGCATTFEGNTLTVDVPAEPGTEAPYDLVRQMRASIIVLGPLLARRGHARVSMPGGCAIGSRKIDLHLRGLERMGAEIAMDHGYLDARCDRLTGTRVVLDFPSVGATENLIMAGVLAKGTTRIENAAREPEIADLCAMLATMGARIAGAGTPDVEIEGVDALRATDHVVVGDRIEAGTYLIAAAATGGDVTVTGVAPKHLDLPLQKLADAGAQVDAGVNEVRVAMPGGPKPVDFVTLPFPGFPTDLMPQMMVLCSLAGGDSIATENVFESRFMFVDEIRRMGADIRLDGHHAAIRGGARLQAAPVRAPDIRAGAALVIAALAAEGETEITGLGFIDRGYERIEERLATLGARIERRVPR